MIPGPASVRRWVALCALAEAVGMTAAAGAARVAAALAGRPDPLGGVAVALGLVVAGGLVEGVAVGAAQARGLGSWLAPRRRAGWVLVTVAVAGLGWAAASAPAVLSSAGGSPPALALVLLGAAGLGLAMGSLLGVAQAPLLRPASARPWRWLRVSAVAWALAMPVIFLGATLPGPAWTSAEVVLTGTATGLAAGAVLGLVTGLLVPWLGEDRPAVAPRVARPRPSAHPGPRVPLDRGRRRAGLR